MARTTEIINILEKYAPIELAEEWDNSGWQIFLGNDYTTKALICLTVTESIIDQAIDLGCNLIISHHPLIFKPLKTIKDTRLIKAIQNNIQIYSLHTNCDKTKNGTSDLIIQKLGLKKPAKINDFIKVGITNKEFYLDDFISFVKLTFNVETIKVINNSNKNIVRTVAVCAGSGADFIPTIDLYNVDVYITSDVKYHDAVDSKRAVILDIGHFESEKPFVEEIKKLLEREKIEVVVANEKPAWTYI